MNKVGLMPSFGYNSVHPEESFNYEWVLNELNKDYNIEGIDRIGFTDDGYEVFIVTDDYQLSDIPHFHYRKKEKGKKMEFHTCIRFDKAEYYYHIGVEDVLNDKQKENLIKFLFSKPKYDDLNSNWELLKFSWNHQNKYQMFLEEELEMPDYNTLKKINKKEMEELKKDRLNKLDMIRRMDYIENSNDLNDIEEYDRLEEKLYANPLYESIDYNLDIIHNITDKTGMINENILKCLLLQDSTNNLNNWIQKIHSLLGSVSKLERIDEFPYKYLLYGSTLECFGDVLMERLDGYVCNINYEENANITEYDKQTLYDCIIDYYRWIIPILSKCGCVKLSSIVDEINLLIKKYNSNNSDK